MKIQLQYEQDSMELRESAGVILTIKTKSKMYLINKQILRGLWVCIILDKFNTLLMCGSAVGNKAVWF